jgi:membrane-associated phospholipid phosphatase
MPLTATRLGFAARSLLSAGLLAPLVGVGVAQELHGPPEYGRRAAYVQDAPGPEPVLPRQHVRRDERRTMRKLPENLGRNVVGLIAMDNLVPFALGAGATGIGFALDDPLQEYFSKEDRLGGLQTFGDKLGDAEVVVPLLGSVFVVGRLIDNQRFRDMSYDLGEAAIVSGLITSGLKLAVGRVRPNGSNDRSFPSGHSSAWFTYASIVQRHYGTWVALPAYGLWALVATSRMDINVHYFSDVIAGAGIGYLVARTAVRQSDRPLPGEPRRKLTVLPWLSPRERGLGVVARLEF